MALRIDDFEWLEVIVEKLVSKHGVEPEDAESVIQNTDPPPYVRKTVNGKYVALGQVEGGGDYLAVVFAMPRPHSARIISARPMDSAEKAEYRRRREGKQNR